MELAVNGSPAYAYTGGKAFDPTRPAVVFIHGAQQDHSCWHLQARTLAHHGRAVLAPDLPGHGRSAGPPPASVEAISAWILALMDAAGVAKAVLVGHSMGSLVALETAGSHPERVARLVLVSTAVPMPVSDALLKTARENEAKAIAMINDWSHGPRAHMGDAPVPGLWMMGMNRRLAERQKPGVLHNDFAACNAYQGGEAASARVACPTLVVIGGRDQMTVPKAGHAAAARIPGARTVEIPGVGHGPMSEYCNGLTDILREFIIA